MEKKHFSLVHLGQFAETDQYSFRHPLQSKEFRGKKFLKEELNLTGMEVSINKLPPGVAIPFLHKHRENEELYLFLKGEGQFCVDGEWFDVREGSAVRVAPEGARTLRSSPTEALHYIVIQAKTDSLAKNGIEDGVPVS